MSANCIQCVKNPRTGPDLLCDECRAPSSFAAPDGSARFLVQRPEHPYWFAGWNEHNLPSWTSHPGHAYLVRYDELVDTLTRLKKHKPIAALYSRNDEVRHAEKKP